MKQFLSSHHDYLTFPFDKESHNHDTNVSSWGGLFLSYQEQLKENKERRYGTATCMLHPRKNERKGERERERERKKKGGDK